MAKSSNFPPLKGEEVVVHVPRGHAGDVKVVETDVKDLGSDITIQVSRHRKPQVSNAIGVIVK